MGLDGVEIVMQVEEAFDISIEDSEAEKIITPGMLVERVLSKVGRTNDAACLTQRAFHRLRASLMRQLDCKRDRIRPETLLVGLFPSSTRKERVEGVLTAIGLRKTIEFVRPKWLNNLLFAGVFAGGIAVAIVLAWHPLSSQSILLGFILGSPILSGVLFVIIFGWVGLVATRSMRTEFQPSLTTLGHLSRWVVAQSPGVLNTPPGQWSREQVSEIVRQIVIDALGCENEYREDAHFVRDLGLS